jgi:hypothetical protein
MAVINAAVSSVFGFTTPIGPYQSGDSPAQQVLGCFVTANFTAGDSYVQADDAAITSVATAIQNARRNGKTVTVLSAATAAPGLEGTSAFGIGIPTAFTSGTISAPIVGADLATERTAGAMGAANRPVCVFVGFKEV